MGQIEKLVANHASLPVSCVIKREAVRYAWHTRQSQWGKKGAQSTELACSDTDRITQRRIIQYKVWKAASRLCGRQGVVPQACIEPCYNIAGHGSWKGQIRIYDKSSRQLDCIAK